jgi:hypothetical protein
MPVNPVGVGAGASQSTPTSVAGNAPVLAAQPVIIAPPGPKGDKGDPGTDGTDGEDGIMAIYSLPLAP